MTTNTTFSKVLGVNGFDINSDNKVMKTLDKIAIVNNSIRVSFVGNGDSVDTRLKSVKSILLKRKVKYDASEGDNGEMLITLTGDLHHFENNKHFAFAYINSVNEGALKLTVN
jgi:hypothetical protein